MTEVSFYTGVSDRQLFACRLLRKAVGSGGRIGVWGPARLLERLDQTLWTFAEREFLPHARVHAGLSELVRQRSPLLLSDQLQDLAQCQVLLNLESQPPSAPERFERLLELVGTEPEQVAAARQRFRDYKQLGLPVQHFDVSA